MIGIPYRFSSADVERFSVGYCRPPSEVVIETVSELSIFRSKSQRLRRFRLKAFPA